MSAQPVDVLAVMDRSASQHWTHQDNADAEDMEAARAAVAELVEADKEYDAAKVALDDAGRRDPGMSYFQWAARYDAAEERFESADQRRRAALARVQGGAA